MERTLVVYTYTDEDPAYKTSLEYFILHAIYEDDNCNYLILIHDNEEGEKVIQNLPELPRNVGYVFPGKAGCHPWISIKKMFNNRSEQLDQFKYFVFVDSSFRGPFLPNSVQGSLHWVEIFTSKINKQVKLVGSIIHCQMSNIKNKRTVTLPHVELAASATDKMGLDTLLSNQRLEECGKGVYGENDHNVEASIAILSANYSLDSFMLRYQGLDWQDKKNWACNGALDPALPNLYDGISIAPLEVMFVPIQQSYIQDIRYVSARAAEMYTKWANTTYRDLHILDNEYDSEWMQKLRQEEKNQLRHKKDCFDVDYYLMHSPDLRKLGTATFEDAWSHFMDAGFEEGRAYRFTCSYADSQSAILDPAVIYSLRSCWDANYYKIYNRDLAGELGMDPSEEALWEHFATQGYKEGRDYRLICNSKGVPVRESSWLPQYEKCFDVQFYFDNNPDLAELEGEQLWQHFMNTGYIENRMFNFNCSNPKVNPYYKPIEPLKKSRYGWLW